MHIACNTDKKSFNYTKFNDYRNNLIRISK